MSGIIAMEGQLNSIVKEYLDYFGFDSTLAKFNEECIQKGKSIANIENRSGSNQKINLIINEMIHLFNQGQRKEFFRRWMENISSNEIAHSMAAQRLEFELNIHFAIYYFRKNKDIANKVQAKEAMNAFKSYMENKGSLLSQIKEYLPYFSLPYHENPQNNFPEIFSEAWLADLQNKLEKFLKDSLKLQSQPRLVELYTMPAEANVNAAKQLAEADKKAVLYFKKFTKAQADYYTLIGIAAELVDTLENTVNGKPVPADYVNSIVTRLFQSKQSIDLTRPGTAGDYIRRSIAIPKSTIIETQSLVQLNYDKVKHDLVHQNEQRQLALLQALRWRLSKGETPELRQRVISAYTSADIIDIRQSGRSKIIQLLLSPNDNVKQYMARFVNTIACFNLGRTYLSSNVELVKMIQIAMKNEKEDTITKQNLLASLQKLSLRRKLQTLMINDNLLEWLLDLLEQNEYLSDLTLEDATALFMNLSLRTEGKKQLAVDYKRTLKILSDLLGNSNPDLNQCVNGTLYSVLSVPIVKEYAREMNLQGILESYLSEANEQIKRQILFLIKQINSNEPTKNDVDSDNEGDDDDDEEDDPLTMDICLDRNELILKQSDDLCGEKLLSSEYAYKNERAKSKLDLTESIILNRPITPLNLKQSILLQTNPFNPSDLFNEQDLNEANSNNNNKKANILVIDSNDISDDYDSYTRVLNNATNKMQSNNFSSSEEVAFATRPKLIRTPDPSQIQKRANMSTSIQASSSIAPKYSISEPRPSSAASVKSKNSSSSGTIVLENSLNSNSSIKKK